LPRTPHWEDPSIRRIHNEIDREALRKLLAGRHLNHLDVSFRGNHLVIALKEEKVPRVRFTRLNETTYQLSVARHTGAWDITPFTGDLPELFTLVTEQFGWLLTDD
jgi:hypothetical protein